MEVVIDTNCLISALIKPGKSRDIVCLLDIEFYAPEHIVVEFLNNRKLILSKSGINDAEFDELVGILLSKIKIVPEDKFKHLKSKSLNLVKHPEDAPFIALALHRNIPLWSNNKALKEQSEIKIYSTTELLKKFDL